MNNPKLNIELYFSDLTSDSESEERESNFSYELKLQTPELLRSLLVDLSYLILTKEQAINALLAAQQLNLQVEVSLVSAQTMKKINQQSRDINQITDVLSFPNFSFDLLQKNKFASKCETGQFDFKIERYYWLDPDAEQGKISLGEILICPLRAAEQAADLQHTLLREICFLYMHGLLHLCGYDHQTEEDSKLMFSLQRIILPELEKIITKYNSEANHAEK